LSGVSTDFQALVEEDRIHPAVVARWLAFPVRVLGLLVLDQDQDMLREMIVQRHQDRDQDMQTPDRLVVLSLSPVRGKGISALHPV
jgi:hypothetical protein